MSCPPVAVNPWRGGVLKPVVQGDDSSVIPHALQCERVEGPPAENTDGGGAALTVPAAPRRGAKDVLPSCWRRSARRLQPSVGSVSLVVVHDGPPPQSWPLRP